MTPLPILAAAMAATLFPGVWKLLDAHRPEPVPPVPGEEDDDEEDDDKNPVREPDDDVDDDEEDDDDEPIQVFARRLT